MYAKLQRWVHLKRSFNMLLSDMRCYIRFHFNIIGISCYQSKVLFAITFGLISTTLGTTICITKNLWVCSGCYPATKGHLEDCPMQDSERGCWLFPSYWSWVYSFANFVEIVEVLLSLWSLRSKQFPSCPVCFSPSIWRPEPGWWTGCQDPRGFSGCTLLSQSSLSQHLSSMKCPWGRLAISIIWGCSVFPQESLMNLPRCYPLLDFMSPMF